MLVCKTRYVSSILTFTSINTPTLFGVFAFYGVYHYNVCMKKVEQCWDRLTKCDTGQRFNPLMHVFMFLLLAFSLGMLIGDPSVMATELYSQTAEIGLNAVNLWGAVGVITLIFHTAGMLIRGRWGPHLLRFAVFGGCYVWLWAAVIYIMGGFWFHLVANALPNIMFWVWYAWQWRKRYNNRDNPFVSAFVN